MFFFLILDILHVIQPTGPCRAGKNVDMIGPLLLHLFRINYADIYSITLLFSPSSPALEARLG
jgi:hypothetical protein